PPPFPTRRSSDLVVGGGDPSSLKRLAEALQVGNQVIFFGSQPDVHRYIEHFDIAVLCSESEGFSNSIIEYMCAGKPVVCSKTGGNPEIVEHGKNGFMFSVGDVEALAAYIRQLLDDAMLRRQLGLAGREWVQQNFSVERMVDAHLNLYRDVRALETSLTR